MLGEQRQSGRSQVPMRKLLTSRCARPADVAVNWNRRKKERSHCPSRKEVTDGDFLCNLRRIERVWQVKGVMAIRRESAELAIARDPNPSTFTSRVNDHGWIGYLRRSGQKECVDRNRRGFGSWRGAGRQSTIWRDEVVEVDDD